MNKRILSLILCTVMLLSLVPHVTLPARAEEESAEESTEKVILDYNCDSLKDSVVSLRGNKYPNYYILDAETGKAENVEAGTIYMACDEEGGGDSSLVFNLPQMSKQTFSMKLQMKVHDLITPEHSALRRGFIIDFQVPNSRNIHMAVNTMKEPDADGRNATVIVRHGWEDTLIHTESIAIPTDDAFHEWELLFNGTDELRLLIDGELQAVFQEIALNAVTSTGFLRIGTSSQNIKSGKNEITIDHIKLTEGIVYSDTQVLLAAASRDSSAKALTVNTILNNVSENTEITVKVINQADRSQTVIKKYTPTDVNSCVTIEDLPFDGVCEVVVSVTGAINYSFDLYLYSDYEVIGTDASITADLPNKAYYFGDMYKIDLPAKTKWKLTYTKDTSGAYGSVLTCQNISDVHQFNVPVKLNGKFAIYVGYVMGTTSFSVNGTEVFVSYKRDSGEHVYERFATADDFKDEEITVSNVTGAPARIAYVKFVPISDETYEKFLAEDDSQNMMIDNDGYSIFCNSGVSSSQALFSRAYGTYPEKINLGQLNWCTFSTSILNYDSEVWWKYVTARLKELNIPEDKWPENFLDHVDNEGVHLEYEHLMRDLDKRAFSNMLAISGEGYPHVLLADYAKENGYGDVYVSLRMSHYDSKTGDWAFQCGTLYYLYPEFIRGGAVYSKELSYTHETYRNYLHDLLLEMASYENIAGVTMDFARYPSIFGSELLDVEARTKIVDDFIKSVYDDLPEGKKLIIRVPYPTDEKAEPSGLNYRHWVEGGYVDRVIIGATGGESFFDFSEHAEYFNRHDNVEFYLGITQTISGHDLTKEEEDLIKQGVELNRNYESTGKLQYMLRAYEAYSAGVDGFFIFNGLDTATVGGIDPAYANLNNKTLMDKWYTMEYPAYIQAHSVTFVKDADVPAEYKQAKAAETTKPAVTTTAAPETTVAPETALPLTETTPAETTADPATPAPNRTPVYIGIGAAILIAAAAAAAVLKKKKTNK